MNLLDIRNFASSHDSCQRVLTAKEARELLCDLELAIHAARVEGRIHENTGKLTKQSRNAEVNAAIAKAVDEAPPIDPKAFFASHERAETLKAVHRAIMDTPHQVMFGAIPSPGQESAVRNQQAAQRTPLDEAIERGMIAPPMPSAPSLSSRAERDILEHVAKQTEGVKDWFRSSLTESERGAIQALGNLATTQKVGMEMCDKRFAALEGKVAKFSVVVPLSPVLERRLAKLEDQLATLPGQSAEACIAKYANWGRRIAELERHWDDLHKRLEALERMHDGQPEKTTAWEKRIEARLMALEARYVHGSGCQKEGDPSTADECIECEPVCQRTYPLDPLTAENPCDDCGRDERKHPFTPFEPSEVAKPVKGTYLDGYQKGREEVQKLKLNSELAESDRKELARYRAHTPNGQLRYGYREDGSSVFDGTSTPAQLAAYETAMSQRARDQAMPAEPKKLSDE